jgi:ABC-type glycerol-3-phosphate transport system substrate-binding protein
MNTYRFSRAFFRWVRLALLVVLSGAVAACMGPTPTPGPQPLWTATPPKATPTDAAVPTGPAATPTPVNATPAPLQVWLPPEFAPSGNGLGSNVLAAQLAQFEQTHPNLAVDVRVKAPSGTGGLLHSLVAAYNVAPAILPNLIALNGEDLASAAAAGLIIPLDTFFPSQALDDYYPFSQALSRRENGERMGLPFAADAQVLVYNANYYAASPLTWNSVTTGTFIFPGGDLMALTVLNEYLALGGTLADSSGKLTLNVDLLAQALAFFRTARDKGILPMSTLAYADTAATWQGFRDGRATLAVTSARQFLAGYERAAAAAGTLIPAPGGQPLALARGWSWAIVNTQPERHADVAVLLTWLTDPAQLSAWTQAAGVLPTRSSVLTGWTPSPRAVFAGEVMAKAQIQPTDAVLTKVGPPLQQALADVLNERATALSAATSVVQAIDKP